jgi:hypothetical protein
MGRRDLAAEKAPEAQVDMTKELNEEIEKSKLKIQVVTEKLKFSVDQFEKIFVLDNAPHGWLRLDVILIALLF